jgi:DNA-binding PadR family transcriptional regulator
MRARPHRTLTPLALAVLRLLHERPMHPYEMHQLVRDRGTDFVIKVRAGSLYHTVERLHGLGLIEPVETGREGRRPERTVYAITGTGRDEFVTNLGDLLRLPVEEYPVFAAALEMLAALDVTAARRLLEQRTIALEAEIAGSEQIIATLTKRGLGRINLIENEYVAHMCRAELAWVRGLIADIDAGELDWKAACRPTQTHTAEPAPGKGAIARVTRTAPPAGMSYGGTTIERTLESEELAS